MPLVKRIISALVVVSVFALISIYTSPQVLALFAALISLIGLLEVNKIFFSEYKLPRLFFLLYGAFALGVLVIKSYSFYFDVEYVLLVIFISSTLWLFKSIDMDLKHQLEILTLSTLGVIYISIFPALIIKLILGDKGVLWFWFLLVMVFSGDTGAYFGGKIFKGKKLMPKISPNKTISGFCSGLFSTLVCAVIFSHFVFPEISLWKTLLLSLTLGLTAPMGDLFESLLKRVSQVKDSGKIMPGHGGVLDRLDGLLFAAPLVYVFSVYIY